MGWGFTSDLCLLRSVKIARMRYVSSRRISSADKFFDEKKNGSTPLALCRGKAVAVVFVQQSRLYGCGAVYTDAIAKARYMAAAVVLAHLR